MRCLIFLLCFHAATVTAAPRVVASITPLQELGAAIMNGIAEPDVIIEDLASVHHFAFKPSDMRLLQQADMVIWIDRHFEAGFNKVPALLSKSTSRLELAPALGVGGDDGHIWYSPTLLLRSSVIITEALIALDPHNRERYQANASALATALETWRRETSRILQNHQPKFVTDHAFTTHFEQDLALAAIASVHDQHHDQGGIRDLNRLEAKLHEHAPKCLLTLESPPSALAQSIAQKFDLEVFNITLQEVTDPEQPRILQRLDKLLTALQRCRENLARINPLNAPPTRFDCARSQQSLHSG